jgi:hypothetical protein
MKVETKEISITAPLHPATSPMKPLGDMSARRTRRDGVAGRRVASIRSPQAIRPRIAGLLLECDLS